MDEPFLQEFQASKYCRVCARESNKLVSLCSSKSDEITLAEKFSFCTQFICETDDERPQSICSKCTRNLKVAYEFCKLAKASEEKFQQWMMLSVPKTQSIVPIEAILVSDGPVEMEIKEEDIAEMISAVESGVFNEPPILIADNFDLSQKASPQGSQKANCVQQRIKKVKKGDGAKPTCSICFATLSRNSALKTHMVKHTGDRPFKCKHCDADFVYRFQLTKHLRFHVGDDIWQCDLCPLSYRFQRELRNHRASEHHQATTDMERFFECYKCKEDIPKMILLRRHMKVHNDSAPNECTVCEMHFSDDKFKRHLCRGKYVRCDYCTQSFETTQSLLAHLDCHKGQYLINRCSYCRKSFASKSLFDWHVDDHHKVGYYFCSICKRHFWDRLIFHTHNSMKHSKVKESAICAVCGKSFSDMGSLRAHTTAKHSDGSKNFSCGLCPKKFPNKTQLKTHSFVHSDIKFACNLCDAKLGSPMSLQQHHKNIHAKSMEHSCSICSLKLATRAGLARHKLIHSGEKPFKCEYCQREYRQRGDMNKHLRTHVGPNTYRCEMCCESFRYRKDLQNHSTEHFRNRKLV